MSVVRAAEGVGVYAVRERWVGELRCGRLKFLVRLDWTADDGALGRCLGFRGAAATAEKVECSCEEEKDDDDDCDHDASDGSTAQVPFRFVFRDHSREMVTMLK